MLKLELTVKKEFDVAYLLAEVGVRYWEDTEVNGVEDENGLLIPCRDGKYWKPLIDLEIGQIVNWELGKTASIHYKSCDDNVFKLLDINNNEIASIEGYVINMMCIGDDGWGDYVIMQVDKDGFIKDFEANFEEFLLKQD